MITFGTDGWRAVIADEFTFANVRALAGALAEYLMDHDENRPIAVGYDTRFLSGEFAEAAAKTLEAAGFEVLLSRDAIPTPCLSYGVHRLGLACGVMITASHNPPRYNGVKLKAWYGGSAATAFTDGVLEYIQRPLKRRGGVGPGGRVIVYDFLPDYLARLEALVNMNRVRDFAARVIFDPMHGAARDLIPRLLAGGRVSVCQIRAEDNPGFGGSCPEPIERNLGALAAAARQQGGIGLATDGDGDRLGAVDEDGRWVSPHEVYAVLLRHFAPQAGGPSGRKVVKTASMTAMVDKLARARGLDVIETDVGFKNIVPHVLSNDILMGGEESGGFCFAGHIPERDGIVAGLKLLEAAAVSGRTLSQLVRGVFDEVGPHYYARIDRPARSNPRPGLGRLAEHCPAELAGLEVVGVRAGDGIKMNLADGSWLFMRASGTEPLLRFYAESTSEAGVTRLLDAAEALWQQIEP